VETEPRHLLCGILLCPAAETHRRFGTMNRFHIYDMLPLMVYCLGKATHVIGRKGLQDCEKLRIPHCLCNRLTDGGNFVSRTHWPRSTTTAAAAAAATTITTLPLAEK
jgi:hypothetical protein